MDAARGVELRGPCRVRQRLGQVALEQRGEHCRRILAGHQVGGERRVEVVGRDAPAPEVVRGLADPVGVVLHQLHLERHLRGEGRVGERALAEAVDGEDGRLVERGLREREARDHVVRAQAMVSRAPRTRRSTKSSPPAGVSPACSARSHASVSTMRWRMRSRSSAVAALVKVSTRICCTSRRCFQQQPQVQPADVPGLAGAGRGLDLADAVQRTREHVQRRAAPSVGMRSGGVHSSNARQSRSGPKTVCAMS